MSLKFMANTRFEEEGDNPESIVKVEIDVEASSAAEEATEVAEVVEETLVDAEQSDAGADQAEVVESVEEMVTEDGVTEASLKLCRKIGLLGFMEAKGLEVPGVESLSAGSRNAEAAAMILAGCEEAKKSWVDTIRGFFAKLGKMLKGLLEKVVNLFRSQNSRAERAYNAIKGASFDDEAGKDKKIKVNPDLADIVKVKKFVTDAKAAIDKAATAASTATVKSDIETLKKDVGFVELENAFKAFDNDKEEQGLTAANLKYIQDHFNDLKALSIVEATVKDALRGAESAKKKFEQVAGDLLGSDETKKANGKKQAEFARACASLISQMNGWAIKIANGGIGTWTRMAQAYASVVKK